ncbi:MAG TPA: amino acid adenylation domain-containing protein, partial [Thermoanaerobaculia bacterium]|nr:amino acid adenylation domain-containing protein [Thermoanaerobaculia bacterium]
LGRGPLFRPVLLRLAFREHLWLGTMHHIVSDGWSMGILVRELTAAYAALAGGPAPSPQAPPALPALPVQYADFAAWQRRRLTGGILAAEIAYWRDRLAALPARLELPADRPREAVPAGAGGSRTLSLPAALAGRLRTLAVASGATPFMVLLAAFQALLGRLAGQLDLAVGTPVAGRDRTEIEGLIGFFVNTLVLRADLSGDPTFAELLQRTRESTLAAYAHQELPFERLVEELAPERNFGSTPLFQVMFALQNAPFPAHQVPGMTLASVPVPVHTAKFDLSLTLADGGAGGRNGDGNGDGDKDDDGDAAPGLSGTLVYKTALFDAATALRWLGHYRALLEAVAAAPGRRLSETPWITPAERHQLLIEWNDQPGEPSGECRTATEVARRPRQATGGRASDGRRSRHSLLVGGAAAAPWEAGGDVLVHAPFARRAAQDPRAIALVTGLPGGPPEAAITYGELAARAAGVAEVLRGMGVGPETIVGVCAEPSFALVTGLLAILEAGGAYLPLDPAHPPERLAQLIGDSGAALAIAEERTAGGLPPRLPVLVLDREGRPLPPRPRLARAAPRTGAHPDQAAYVIYTSGSTGTPKGVVVSHRAAVNRLRYQLAADLHGETRVLMRARITFDVSVVEIFGTLWQGGTLVLPEPARQQDPPYLARLVAEREVTNLTSPPGMLPALLAEEPFRRCRSLRRLVVGGERVPADLPPRLARAMDGAGPLFIARYGPTEATVSVAEWTWRGEAVATASVPLGRPIAGARLYVLDGAWREVPAGVAGELCIAGICLARGYLGRPDLTAAAFVPDPFCGRRDAGAAAAAGTADAGGRLYRTGDLARRRADGVLEFLGRIDRQVKVRGFRLELGEVEAALSRHPAVREAAVVDRDEPAGGGKRLVAYVVPRGNGRPAIAADAEAMAGTASPAGTRLAAGPKIPAGKQPQTDRGLATPDPRSLRAFVERQLPSYMVPSAFVVLERLPLTPNGKLDRAALPEPLAAQGAGAAGRVLPRTPVEELLAVLWAEILGISPAPAGGGAAVGVTDDFFELGGHSLLAIRLMARIRERFGRELPVASLFRAPTIERLASLLAAGPARPARHALVELTPTRPSRRPQKGGRSAQAFFCVHPAGGNVLCYAELARALGPGQPFFGLQLPDLDALGAGAEDATVEGLAAHYLAALAAVAPAGPYALGGWSLGGAVAYEMACQLRAAGEEVRTLALIDPAPLAAAAPGPGVPEARLVAEFAYDLLALAGRGGAAPGEAWSRSVDLSMPLPRLAAAAQEAGLLPPELGPDEVARLFELFRITRRALDRYRPSPYPGRLTLLLAARPAAGHARNGRPHPAAAWTRLAGGGAEIESLPGDHYSIMRAPAVAALAGALARRLVSGRRVAAPCPEAAATAVAPPAVGARGGGVSPNQ